MAHIQKINTTKTDYRTGEIVEKETVKIFNSRTPSFVKIFQMSLNQMSKCSGNEIKVLLILSINMDYNNKIIITNEFMEMLIKHTNMAERSIRKLINTLCKKQMLFKTQNNVYQISENWSKKGK